MSYEDGEVPPESVSPRPKDDDRNPPVFNLPPLLVGILAVLLVAYVVPTYLLSEDGYGWFIFTFGFIPLRYAVPFRSRLWNGSGRRLPIHSCMAAWSIFCSTDCG